MLDLYEERSKLLFGQAHRLRLMIAIANASDGRVNPSDLALDLRLPQSSFQAPLKSLLEAGLLTKEPTPGPRNYYARVESKVWDWVVEQGDLVEVEIRRKDVRRLHSY